MRLAKPKLSSLISSKSPAASAQTSAMTQSEQFKRGTKTAHASECTSPPDSVYGKSPHTNDLSKTQYLTANSRNILLQSLRDRLDSALKQAEIKDGHPLAPVEFVKVMNALKCSDFTVIEHLWGMIEQHSQVSHNNLLRALIAISGIKHDSLIFDPLKKYID